MEVVRIRRSSISFKSKMFWSNCGSGLGRSSSLVLTAGLILVVNSTYPYHTRSWVPLVGTDRYRAYYGVTCSGGGPGGSYLHTWKVADSSRATVLSRHIFRNTPLLPRPVDAPRHHRTLHHRAMYPSYVYAHSSLTSYLHSDRASRGSATLPSSVIPLHAC